MQSFILLPWIPFLFLNFLKKLNIYLKTCKESMTYGSKIIIYVLIMQNQTYDKISKSSKVTLCLRQQST